MGYQIDAFDASAPLAALAEELLNQSVTVTTFENFTSSKRYDGIWACASLLHVTRESLPGTGTPVCGGLSSDKILKIIRALKGINLIGMDVVEVSPPYDQSDLTSLAGATIALELLYVWASNKKDEE